MVLSQVWFWAQNGCDCHWGAHCGATWSGICQKVGPLNESIFDQTQGVQMIFGHKNEIYESQKKIYESQKKSMNISVRAKLHILLEARSAENERGPSGLRDDHQRPKIQPEGRATAGFGEMYFSLVSMHLSIINCCFLAYFKQFPKSDVPGQLLSHYLEI